MKPTVIAGWEEDVQRGVGFSPRRRGGTLTVPLARDWILIESAVAARLANSGAQAPSRASKESIRAECAWSLAAALLLLLLRQVRPWVVHLAAAVLDYFVAEGRAVVLLVRQGIGLALVVPALRIQALGFLEVRNGLRRVAGFVDLLAQAELGGGHGQVRIAGGELFAEAVFAHHEG